jgi:hypothetical protein
MIKSCYQNSEADSTSYIHTDENFLFISYFLFEFLKYGILIHDLSIFIFFYKSKGGGQGQNRVLAHHSPCATHEPLHEL